MFTVLYERTNRMTFFSVYVLVSLILFNTVLGASTYDVIEGNDLEQHGGKGVIKLYDVQGVAGIPVRDTQDPIVELDTIHSDDHKRVRRWSLKKSLKKGLKQVKKVLSKVGPIPIYTKKF